MSGLVLDPVKTPADAVRRYCELFARAAHEAIRERDRFIVILSGGKTVKPVFHTLCRDEYSDIPWEKGLFLWADERYVPAGHAENNARAAIDLLLAPRKVSGDRIHRVPTGSMDPIKDAMAYEGTLKKTFPDGPPRADIALLGVGPDGHVASLFPGSPALSEQEAWVAATRAPSGQARSRISLTPKVLAASRLSVLIAVGSEKARSVERLVLGEEGPDFPLSLAKPTEGDWVLVADSDARSRLSS